MIGPSSSHTAGAARLARVARLIAGKPFTSVSFGLYGSFAKTFRGHGTDKALVAGILGIKEDDERLGDSFQIAESMGIGYRFYETKLKNVHENSALITFYRESAPFCEVTGSSVGGGQIVIKKIDGFDTDFSATSPTLAITHYDRKGMISAISKVLFDHDINIAVMRLSRTSKGDIAFCMIEADGVIPETAVNELQKNDRIISVKAINPQD